MDKHLLLTGATSLLVLGVGLEVLAVNHPPKPEVKYVTKTVLVTPTTEPTATPAATLKTRYVLPTKKAK